MHKHCMCCNCKLLQQYQQLNSVDEQITFLFNLNTLDRLQLIVNDKSFTYIDELLELKTVIDMKKLLYHIKARFAMIDCDDLHTFTDIADKHIKDFCSLIADYIIFQIDVDCRSANQNNQHQTLVELNFEIIKYMFDDECEFILSHILQTQEQKEKYVNTLMRRHFIYKDCFKQYVTNETIRHFIDFHH